MTPQEFKENRLELGLSQQQLTLVERMDEFIIKLESEDGEFLEDLDLEFLKWIQQKDINKIHFNK